MIRPFATLALLAALGLGASTAIAQEALPTQPETPQIVVDPSAPIDSTPKQANMLTGFYATMAVIELCAVTLDPQIAEGMTADRQRLELALAMDPATAAKAFAEVKADVQSTNPDCAQGSADRQSVDAVIAIYQAQSAPPAQ